MTSARTTKISEAEADHNAVRSATRGSALNMIGAVTAATIGFITVGVITNTYGQAGAGLFFSATAVFTLAANAARLGGESGLTYFISRLRATDGHGALKAVTATALGATAVASGLLAVVGFFLAPALARALTTEPDNEQTMIIMIRVLAVAVPSFALSQSLFGASRGFGTMKPSVIAGQIVRPVAQLVFVVAAVVASSRLWPLSVAWAGASVLAMVVVAVWLARRLRRISRPRQPFAALEYWRFTAPRAVSDLVSSALERIDILLVAYFLSEADAGLYGASNRLIVAGQLMMYATAQAMAPHLAASFSRGRLDAARSLLNTITGWNVTLLWPVFLGLAFGAETVLGLFGDGFGQAAPVVRILALSLLVVIGLGVGDTLLLMTGDSVASLINHVVALIVMVGASAILLPRVGLVGAAWAWALSRILIRALAVFRVWQTTGVHVFGRSVVVAALLATVAFVPTGFMAYRVMDSGPGALAVHILAGGLVHLALVFGFRHDLEFDQFLNVISPGSPGSERLAAGSTEGGPS